MGHVPHFLVEPPWDGDRLGLTEAQIRHLERVLRLGPEAPVSYTDGRGTAGDGVYRDGSVLRGEEREMARPSRLVVVAAPPASRDRVRFMVEKLAELGVARLRFLVSRYAQGRPPRAERLRSWAVAGLEQSRGAWLLDTSPHAVALSDLSPPYAVCDPSGSADIAGVDTVVIGPEGGWDPDELPSDVPRLALGSTILRVETAAVVAAARTMTMLESEGPGS